MASEGKCLLNTESGLHHSVRVQDVGGTRDVEIPVYEQRGYKPDWRTLPDCPGTPPRKTV